jgi:hypothetical protein
MTVDVRPRTAMLTAAMFVVVWLSAGVVLAAQPSGFVSLGLYFGVGLMVAVAALWVVPGLRTADPAAANRAVLRGLVVAVAAVVVEVVFAMWLVSQVRFY